MIFVMALNQSRSARSDRFRLFQNQTPERVFRLVLDHIATVGFGDVEVQMVSRNPWARCPVDSGSVQPLVRAMDAAFGRGLAIQHSFAGSGPEGVF